MDPLPPQVNFKKLISSLETEEGQIYAKENAVIEGFLSPRSVPDFNLDDHYQNFGYDDYDSRTDFNKFRRNNAKRKGNLDLIVKAYSNISQGHQGDHTGYYLEDKIKFQYQLRAAGLMLLMEKEKKAKEILEELSKLDFENSPTRDNPWLIQDYHTRNGIYLGDFSKQLLEELSSSPKVDDGKKDSGEKEWQFVEREYQVMRDWLLVWKVQGVNSRGGAMCPAQAEPIRTIVRAESEREEFIKIAKNADESRLLKAQFLLEAYADPRTGGGKGVEAARVVALIGNRETAVDGYRQEGKYLEAVQVCLRNGRREQATEIYQDAKDQLEPQCLLYGLNHLGKIAEALGEAEKGRNYRLLAFLVGELGRS